MGSLAMTFSDVPGAVAGFNVDVQFSGYTGHECLFGCQPGMTNSLFSCPHTPILHGYKCLRTHSKLLPGWVKGPVSPGGEDSLAA